MIVFESQCPDYLSRHLPAGLVKVWMVHQITRAVLPVHSAIKVKHYYALVCRYVSLWNYWEISGSHFWWLGLLPARYEKPGMPITQLPEFIPNLREIRR